MKRAFDVAIVGGGHNGLTSAAYLARHGLSVLVAERRNVLGGAAVTEEIVAGFQFSRCSYVLSLLRPQIRQELQLDERGLKLYERNPSSFTPLITGGHLTLGKNQSENVEEVSKFCPEDGHAFLAYEETLRGFAKALDPLLDISPAELSGLSWSSAFRRRDELKRAWHAAKKVARANLPALSEILTAPIDKILKVTFKGDALKATLATDALIGGMIGPNTPGGG